MPLEHLQSPLYARNASACARLRNSAQQHDDSARVQVVQSQSVNPDTNLLAGDQKIDEAAKAVPGVGVEGVVIRAPHMHFANARLGLRSLHTALN